MFFIRHKVLFSLLIILTLAAFLRFYKAYDLFVFTADEEYALALSQTIVNDFHIVWIGENASNTGFYMGPFWVYFTSIWLYLSGGMPGIVAYVAAGIGVLTTLIMFLTARILFGFKTAMFSTLLYATLPLTVYYDKKYWLLSPAPLISLSLLLTIYLTRFSIKWWIAVAFLYGMVFHIHLSLVPYGLLIIYCALRQKSKLVKNKKIVFLTAAAFLFTISPLIMFDYFHKGSNIATPFRVAEQVKERQNSFNAVGHLKTLFISLGRLWYLAPNRSNSDEVLHACSPYYLNKNLHIPEVTTTNTQTPIWLSFFSFFLLGWFLIRKATWKKESTKLLALSLIFLLLAYILLPNVPLEYYLTGSFPLLLFIPGLVTQLSNKSISFSMVFLILAFSLLGIFTIATATSEYGLSTKIQLIKKVMTVVKDKKFELKEEGLCHGNEGWRLLFKKYGRMPERSSTDKSLGYLYPDEISKSPVDYRIIVSEARIPVIFNSAKAHTISEGGFRAYIF